jgi:hypothetical protein
MKALCHFATPVNTNTAAVSHLWRPEYSVFFKIYTPEFHDPVTMHHDKLLIIDQLDALIYQNFILEWNSTCFRHFHCPSSEVFHCTHSNGICHTGLLTACKQDRDRMFWSWSQAVSKPVWHIPLLCAQWKTPDDGQRNCPKHVDFHSKIKFW